jgi:hypothetical protein
MGALRVAKREGAISQAEYDQACTDLVALGVAFDSGMFPGYTNETQGNALDCVHELVRKDTKSNDS